MSRCRIYPASPPIDRELATELGGIPVAILSDQLERTGGLRGILPVADMPVGSTVVGRALTVRTRPGDNLVVHKAVDLAEPGDFLVIDAGGLNDRSVIGDILCSYAASRGIAAIALDGMVRDIAELRAGSLPIFALGVTHVGPYKVGPGEIRGPVSVGGTVVRSGDYVVGDADGVVVVPRGREREVLANARVRAAKEAEMLTDIKSGQLDRSWVDAALDIEYVTEDQT